MPRSRPASSPISFHKPTGQYYVTRGGKRSYPDLLALIASAMRAAVHRNLLGEDAAGTDKVPPPQEGLAVTVRSLLDNVSKRGNAKRIVWDILQRFAPSAESARDTTVARSSAISDEQLRAMLIEDARHGLADRLGTDDLDAYVPLPLLERTESGDVEPRAVIGPRDAAPDPSMSVRAMGRWMIRCPPKQEERQTEATPEPPPRGHDVAKHSPATAGGRRSVSGARRHWRLTTTRPGSL